MLGFWTRPLAFLERCRARYGRTFTVRLPLSPPFVMLSTPDEIKQVFTAPADVLHPGAGARVLEPVVGRNSVILLDGDEHMEQRRLMLPAFHGERIADLSALVERVAAQAVAGWPSDRPVRLHERLQDVTLEIILRAVFGLEPGARLDELRARLRAMLKFGEKPISLLPPPPEGRMAKVLERVGPFAPFVRMQREADEMLFTLIDERRSDQLPRDDVLTMLLGAKHEDGEPMSREELRDELMTLLVAGHETTASTLAWAFDRLARSPDVVRRLRDDGEEYLTATVQEVLRHRPVLPNVAPRLVVSPIEVGGQSYPEGVCLVPNAYLLHHDPALYPDPYAFRPERFLEEPPGTYTWIPFGGGRRRCLGASFAMLEMKLLLQIVVRERELEPIGEQFELPRRRNITVMPGGRCRVRLPVRRGQDREPEPAALALSGANN
jgi:cytochrome P450